MPTTYLEAGKVLTVTASSVSAGSVTRLADVPGGGEAIGSTAVAAGTTQRFGPFSTVTRWEITSTSGALVYSAATPRTESDLGGLAAAGGPAGTGVSASELAGGAVHQTVLTLSAVSITMTDATTAGCHGSQKLYDFPAGAIQIQGSSYNLTTLAGSGGIADNAALVGSLGSAAVGTDNATLTSTEADIIASTTGTLSGGAGTLKKHGSSVATAFDGTSTALDLFLNLAVPDAGSSADDTITVSGTVTVFWINLGDY